MPRLNRPRPWIYLAVCVPSVPACACVLHREVPCCASAKSCTRDGERGGERAAATATTTTGPRRSARAAKSDGGGGCSAAGLGETSGGVLCMTAGPRRFFSLFSSLLSSHVRSFSSCCSITVQVVTFLTDFVSFLLVSPAALCWRSLEGCSWFPLQGTRMEAKGDILSSL